EGLLDVRDARVLELLERPLRAGAEVPDTEREPGILGHVGDERALRSLDAIGAADELEIEAVGRGRQGTGHRLVERLAGALLEQRPALLVELRRPDRVDQGLRNGVEGPEPVAGKLVEAVLEV